MAKMRRWQPTWKNRRRIDFFFPYEVGTREGFASANRQIDAVMYDNDAEVQSNRKLPEDERIKTQNSNKNHRW